ncbi:MAG TPA: FAD:protein FMN transferase [Deltaproteobacteria bacterium]|nr:FAD:protein FMN transferase [Deltaproteobacteria bacterium]
MRKILFSIISVVLIIGIYLVLSGGTSRLHSMQFFAMGTIVEIQGQGSKNAVEAAIKKASEELIRIERIFGYQDSLITELNSFNTIKDAEIFTVMQQALEIHRASSGAFSLTMRPILDAWGFTGTHPYRLPTDDEFLLWKSLPGEEGIVLADDGESITTAEGLKVDLAGIVKGYAADRAATILRQQGVRSGLINAGGDIATFGEKTWRIGIKNPQGPGIIATIPIKDRSIATSGSYERFFETHGTRYSHILDPETGWPVDHVISTTVIAATCIEADAWATALFVRGVEPLKELLEARSIQWIVIDKDGKISSSPSLENLLPEKLPGIH